MLSKISRCFFWQSLTIVALGFGVITISSCGDKTGGDSKKPKPKVATTGLVDPSAKAVRVSLENYRGPECGEEVVLSAEPICGAATYVVAPHESCGAITEERVDPRCGPQSHNSGPHESCGVAMYKERVDALCGQSSRVFWSDWGKGCPSGSSGPDFVRGVVSGTVEYRVKGGFPPKVQRRTRCTETTTHRCRRPEFGAETFNSCPHASFGVASYRRCAVPVGFKSCAHQANGVATYKACEVGRVAKSCRLELDGAELEAWVDKQAQNLAAEVERGLLAAARTYEVAAQAEGASCLIARLVRSDFFEQAEAARTERVYAQLVAVTKKVAKPGTEGEGQPSFDEACSADARVSVVEVCAAGVFEAEACKAQREALAVTSRLELVRANAKAFLEQRTKTAQPAGQADAKLEALIARLDRILARPSF